MQVTTAIKHLVLAKLQDGLDRAEKRYGRKFAMPRVVYEKRGGTAGTASYSTNTIDLNPILLMQNVVDFIERTVPHELAHIIDHALHPENFETQVQWTRRGYRRTKRDVHGASWQSVCYVLGMTDVTRCHAYDTSAARTKQISRYEWFCTGCKTTIQLGPKHNASLQRGGQVWHKGCRGHKLIKPTGAIDVVIAPTVQKVDVQKKPEAGSKLDKCWNLYKSYSHVGRGGLIAMFVNEAGCTVAGAGTYYATCKKKYEAGVI